MPNLPYRLIRSSRKTLSVQITPQGEIIVRCPRFLSRKAADAFVAQKEPWIRQHLAKLASREALPPLSPSQLKALADQAREVIPERAAALAQQVGVSYGRITIRAQRTRWGSCSARGNLNFNCLLMLVPQEVRDYVIVHELCHRLELNHSAAFWAQVGRVIPDYPRHRAWLKDHGSALIGRLPDKNGF